MPEPLSMGALAAIGAGLGVAQGVGGAIAAKRAFSPEMEERMQELQMLRETGQLGLSEVDRQALEASLAAQRSAGLRQAQTVSEQQRQAAGGSGRELFLAEMAGAQAEQEARAAGAQIIAQQEAAATAAQQAELMGLQQQQAAAKAAAISALTGGIAEGGQMALTAGMQAQAQQAALDLEAERGINQIAAAAAAAGYRTGASGQPGYMGG